MAFFGHTPCLPFISSRLWSGWNIWYHRAKHKRNHQENDDRQSKSPSSYIYTIGMKSFLMRSRVQPWGSDYKSEISMTWISSIARNTHICISQSPVGRYWLYHATVLNTQTLFELSKAFYSAWKTKQKY